MVAQSVTSSTSVTDLTAVSALGSPPLALNAWNLLNELVPFDLLPHTVIRAMPQIYINLQGEEDVTERPRLRGVYRASWSNNAMRFAASHELFSTFNNRGVSYRVIKGGAMAALAGHWGLRRMGDIDVVITPRDEQRSMDILRELNYFQKIVEGEDSGRNPGFLEGTWNNSHGAVLDLHSVSGKAQIFADLFDDPGSVITLTQSPLHIPSPELMFALSVWHGKKATAGTDQIQTLLDLGTLVGRVDFSRMKEILLRSNLLDSADYYISSLERLDLIDPVDRAHWNHRSLTERIHVARSQGKRILNTGARISTFPVVAKRRSLNKDQKQALRQESGIRARAYQLWSTTGQLRPIERLMHTRFGGFGDFSAIGGPITGRDFRIRIPAAKGVPSRLRVHFIFDDRGDVPTARALFINGLIQGHVPLPDNAPGIYEVTPENDFVEVSVRCFSNTNSSAVVDWTVEWQ